MDLIGGCDFLEYVRPSNKQHFAGEALLMGTKHFAGTPSVQAIWNKSSLLRKSIDPVRNGNKQELYNRVTLEKERGLSIGEKAQEPTNKQARCKDDHC